MTNLKKATFYSFTYLNLKEDGPTVIEAPPGVLGLLDDMWLRYVADVGLGGADKTWRPSEIDLVK